MSNELLERIKQAKNKLRNVETTVTLEDGTQVQERRAESGEILRESSSSENTAISNKQRKKLEFKSRLGFIVDLNPDLQLAEVHHNIFLGSQDVAADFQILKTGGVTHILNCATGVRNVFPDHFTYLKMDILDLPTAPISQYFDEAHSFIKKCVENGGKILVHCNAGISRSTTLVVSYLMRFHGLRLDDALTQVKKVRPPVRPNDGFMKELKRWDTKCFEEASL